MKFNLLDGIFLAVLTFGLWRGYVAGMIREVAQLFGMFVGFAIALQLMKPAAVFMVSVVNIVELPLEAMALISFVTVFLVVYLLVYLASRMLERVADGAKLGPVNKLFGTVAGVAKAALGLSIVLVFLGQIGIPGQKAESASYLHGTIEKIAPEAWEVVTRSVPAATKLTNKVGERFWERPEEEEEGIGRTETAVKD